MNSAPRPNDRTFDSREQRDDRLHVGRRPLRHLQQMTKAALDDVGRPMDLRLPQHGEVFLCRAIGDALCRDFRRDR